jgi:RelA/SpoT family (p)ppGpp synthetase
MLRQYELVEKVRGYDPQADEAMLNRAYVFSMKAHGSQKRASGDPYYSHPIEVAGILTDLHLDDETIVTAILHDTIEDTVATREEIERLFGENVARLVDGVTKLSKIEAQTESQRAAENLRKFLLAMSDDIRVLLVKLADRLHNMRTLHHIKNDEKRRRIARETMDIYAPLAERIGMYEFMTEMQTLAFKELEPDAYQSITRRLEQLREGGGGDLITRIGRGIKAHLEAYGIEAEVKGREKHPYSIWRKMAERHVSFEALSDVMAFRAVVDSVEECYRTLGLIHQRWPTVPGRFKDFISTPKQNGYRSIHTTVIHDERMRIEVQIRTREMHAQAEHGLAAHWAYKEGHIAAASADHPWISDLVEILEHAASAEELLEHTRMAMYQDKIFAFTPKGELIQLPKGATPVDFAYAIHSDLGDQTVGAKINGRMVPLRTPLENGDQVEILVSKAQHPQPNWLAFVITGKARANIRRWVKSKERQETIALGRKIFDEIQQRLPAPPGWEAMAEALRRLHLPDDDSLMEAIATKRIDDVAVMEALLPGSTRKGSKPPPQQTAISIKGLTPGVAFQLAPCCHPIPGDRIVGLRREGEGIEIHSIGCDSLADGQDADWVDIHWGDEADGGTARLCIVIKNVPGALAGIANVIARDGANIVSLDQTARDGAFHTFLLDVEVHDLEHLMRLIAALRSTDLVSSAERI